MNRAVPFLIFAFFTILGCKKNTDSLGTSIIPPPPAPPAVVPPTVVSNEYDATYTLNSGTFGYYSYHVKDFLYYSDGKNYRWETLVYNAHDTLYSAYSTDGQTDSSFALSKGCTALVSSIDPSQQANYNYYIGSYYKFSLFNDTAVGNIQFMIPADGFSSVDSIPVGVAFLNYYGGTHSFYNGMANAETKITSALDFVRLGDNFSYANPMISAQGAIDSVEVHMLVTRFSDNGIHPDPKITKTMDANYFLSVYFHDGSWLTLINGKFTNLFFQKTPI